MNQHRTSLIPALGLCLLLLTTGCETGGLAASDPGEANLSFPHYTIEFARIGEEHLTLAPEETERLARTIKEVGYQYGLVVAESQDWQEADTRFRSLIAEPSDLPGAHREQFAAYFMLTQYLLDGGRTPERLEATGYYTDLLVQNHSPEAAVVADALDRLEGHWTDERRAEAATIVLAAAADNLGRRLDCTDCPQERILDRLPAEARARSDHALTQKAEAVERLRAMAAG